MPKLWILSDLHLETLPYPDEFRPDFPDFDVLVSAGDIWEGSFERTFEFLRRLARSKPVVFVPGNHEYWGWNISEGLSEAVRLAPKYGITLLGDKPVEVAECVFHGTTLWSDYGQCDEKLDPRRITGEGILVESGDAITIGDIQRLNRSAVDNLKEGISTCGPDRPLVVVTHHAPHPDSLPEEIKGTWAAGNSASDLSCLTDGGRVSLWVHGHIHQNADYVRPGGTRVLCNPAGVRFSNPSFDETLTVDVGMSS